ncbi:MAG: ROK family protein [Bacteroidetes bacterium]|nr:MAG: ROK family protein [Bacteroidota bacterium]
MEILGIDVGGTGIKGALVNTETGELITERKRIPTPQPATPVAVTKTVKKLVDFFQWKGPIGCGFPAPIQHGVARMAANIDKAWVDLDVEEMFLRETGCQVSVINDADAAGLAEANLGAGHGRPGLTLLLTIGTGIGSAFIIDGQLVPNSELGHLRFKGGIAEHYASDSARKKHNLSWSEWGKRFNEYLNHVHGLFYPDLVILGGGGSKKFHKYEAYLDVPSKVVPAELLNQAGIVGAALSAQQLIKRSQVAK